MIKVRPYKLEMVASFCYLVDMLSFGRGYELQSVLMLNGQKDVQGTTASSNIPPSLRQEGGDDMDITDRHCREWKLNVQQSIP